MLRVASVVFFCLFAFGLGQLPPSENFDHNTILDNNGDVRLWWKFNATYITFELQGKTTGWVGLGFSPGGGMANADIYVGWVANGVANVTDRHGEDSNAFPPLDGEQNVETLGGLEESGWTRVKFVRPITACDSDDMTITSNTMRVIYALGSTDGPDIQYHGATNRGTRSLIVLTYANDGQQPPAGETTSNFDLLNDNFAVPAVDTYYNCRVLEIPPAINTPQHIVQIEGVVQTGNEAHVHHILLYECPVSVNGSSLGVDNRCYDGSPPEHLQCTQLLAAWAIGSSAFVFPNHVGFPIGNADSPKFVLMETHYDNPTLKNDIVDSSGLKITYTPQLRQHDAGVILVGHIVSPFAHLIPPNTETFEDYSECGPRCLTDAIGAANVTSVNAFAVLLHSHLLGRSLELKHVRNGTELEPIASDNNYDFNYQETRTLPQEVTIKPDDSLQMLCNYNSKGRSNVTYGGFGTYQEMCVSFLYYYPKIQLTDCTSTPDFGVILGYYLGITNVSVTGQLGPYSTLESIVVTEPPELAGLTVMEIVNAISWNETVADEFSMFLQAIPHSQQCYPVDLKLPAFTFNLTKTLQPYVAPTPNCSQNTETTTMTTTTTMAATTTSITTTSSATLLRFSPVVQMCFTLMLLVTSFFV
uniref:DBH-like monooxygenase protein 1 homolog n=1 Tax=Phallusia mammillata TaxID=59560 RepID=A0A6F9DLQ5_9ASCI|nr:DBH-like monooxygenase protein 1 homolog [Phallusia mammillata]